MIQKLSSFSKIFAVGVVALLLLFSCKDRQDDSLPPVQVQFHVVGKDVSKINAVVTQIGTVQDSKFDIAGTEFISPVSTVQQEVGSLHLSASATGLADDSRLTLTILLNGAPASVKVVNGKNLSATTSVQLYQQYK